MTSSAGLETPVGTAIAVASDTMWGSSVRSASSVAVVSGSKVTVSPAARPSTAARSEGSATRWPAAADGDVPVLASTPPLDDPAEDPAVGDTLAVPTPDATLG